MIPFAIVGLGLCCSLIFLALSFWLTLPPIFIPSRPPRPQPLETHPLEKHVGTVPMKEAIHPTTHDTTITCTCGAVYNTLSTVKTMKIGICAACHPFFTGETRFIDTAGRVDKFAQRYGSTTARRVSLKPGAAAAAAAVAS